MNSYIIEYKTFVGDTDFAKTRAETPQKAIKNFVGESNIKVIAVYELSLLKTR